MREIKFRYVWGSGKPVLITTEIFSIEQIEDGEMEDFIYAEQSELGESLKLIERNLYTGLKDKNGKEIYEGDIFASGVIGSICQDRSDCPLYRVVFKEGSFLGQSIPYEEEYSIYIRPEDCEVIGNIHENLELLNE